MVRTVNPPGCLDLAPRRGAAALDDEIDQFRQGTWFHDRQSRSSQVSALPILHNGRIGLGQQFIEVGRPTIEVGPVDGFAASTRFAFEIDHVPWR